MKLHARLGWTLLAPAMLMLAACAHRTDDANAVLRHADEAMGGVNLTTLRYAGSGTANTFGQAYRPGMPWPRQNLTSFSRLVDYQNAALREDAVRTRAEPTGGGALPLMGTGELRTTGLLRGNNAWNLAGATPVPAALSVDGRVHDLWTTPHGVIKAALRNNAILHRDGSLSRVSFEQPGRFRATAWITADGMVERVESVQPNPVLGDTATVTIYSGYRDFGGVRFPTRIRQDMGGFAVLDMEVREVQINLPSGIEVPAEVLAATERVAVEKVADGVWFLAGGSHNSVLIEMKDHLMLVESPLYEARAQAVLAEARRLVPGKEIRYVINSHHHFDHSGGLRTAAATGATLVTSDIARPWFETVLANPNSISPDALARSGRTPVLTSVDGQRSFTDGEREVQVSMIQDSVHAQGFMMVWLPRERLLVEADAYTPGPPNAPVPAVPNANQLVLAQNIERMKMNVDRILPLHGRIVQASELYRAIGR